MKTQLNNIVILFLLLLSSNNLIAGSNNNCCNKKQLNCYQDSSKINSDSVRKNNEASKILISALKEYSPDIKEALFKRALELINQSIRADSNNFDAYINRINTLIKLKERQVAISTIDKLFSKKNTYAEIIETKGFLLEKMGKIDDAKYNYTKAIDLFNNRPKKDSAQIISDKCSSIFLLAFLNNRETALKKIEELEHSNQSYNNLIDDIKTAIILFNKEEFLKNY